MELHALDRPAAPDAVLDLAWPACRPTPGGCRATSGPTAVASSGASTQRQVAKPGGARDQGWTIFGRDL